MLSGGRIFATIEPGSADGFRLDTDGNVWTSAGDGVHCFSPNGDLLGKVRVPEVVSNLSFGGLKRNGCSSPRRPRSTASMSAPSGQGRSECLFDLSS